MSLSQSWWSDRPLGVKLSALVAAGAVSLGVFGVIAVAALEETGARTEELLATTTATGSAYEADMMHDPVRADVLQALLSGSGSEYETAVTDLEDHADTLQSSLATVQAAGLGPDVAAAVDSVADEVAAYLATAQQIVTLAGTDPAAARADYPGFLTAFDELEQALPTVGAAVAAEAAAAVTESRQQRESAIASAIGVGIGAVLLLGLLGWVVTRSVVGPLRRVRAVVAGLAEGDLRGSTGVTSSDEVGQIARALEESMATMRGLLGTIGDSSTALASATEELSATAQDMTRLAGESATQTGVVAETAGQVSANVQTVAAGTDEMGTSIREIAQNASDVSRIARPGGRRRGVRDGDDRQAGRVLRRDRHRRRRHHLDRRADEPAGAQRHHRGRPGR